jgi:hypothetical protein
MAEKKSKKTSKAKPTKKPSKSIKYTSTGNFQTVLSALSSYLKSSGSKTQHRGSYAKKAGEIFNAIKDKPQWEENLDVIIPQFLEKAYFEDEEIQIFDSFINDNGFDRFFWFDSYADFDTLMLKSQYWKNDYVLRIEDEHGNYKDCREFNQYERSVWAALAQDYKAKRFGSDYPEFMYKGIERKNEIYIVKYLIDGWDFIGYDETLSDVENLIRDKEKSKEESEKDKKKPKEPAKEKDVDFFDLELEKFKVETESQRKKAGFDKEMDLLQKDYEAGRISRAELKEEKNEIRRIYNIIP